MLASFCLKANCQAQAAYNIRLTREWIDNGKVHQVKWVFHFKTH